MAQPLGLAGGPKARRVEAEAWLMGTGEGHEPTPGPREGAPYLRLLPGSLCRGRNPWDSTSSPLA